MNRKIKIYFSFIYFHFFLLFLWIVRFGFFSNFFFFFRLLTVGLVRTSAPEPPRGTVARGEHENGEERGGDRLEPGFGQQHVVSTLLVLVSLCGINNGSKTFWHISLRNYNRRDMDFYRNKVARIGAQIKPTIIQYRKRVCETYRSDPAINRTVGASVRCI